MVRVKVCGITRLSDALECAKHGVDVLGFVREKTSKRYFSGEKSEIERGLSILKSSLPWIPFCGVYGHWYGDEASECFDILQGFDVPEEKGERRVKVLRVSAETSVNDLMQESFGHGLVLLDALSTDGYGGTGEPLDWGLASEFVSAFDGWVVLAGGLNPENVGEAVRRVRPFGVDASSGLEISPGIKDLEKVKAFVLEAKGS